MRDDVRRELSLAYLLFGDTPRAARTGHAARRGHLLGRLNVADCEQPILTAPGFHRQPIQSENLDAQTPHALNTARKSQHAKHARCDAHLFGRPRRCRGWTQCQNCKLPFLCFSASLASPMSCLCNSPTVWRISSRLPARPAASILTAASSRRSRSASSSRELSLACGRWHGNQCGGSNRGLPSGQEGGRSACLRRAPHTPRPPGSRPGARRS